MRRTLLLVICAAATACGVDRPYGQPEALPTPEPHAHVAGPLAGEPRLVLGALEDLTVQPQGGVYAERESSLHLAHTLSTRGWVEELRAGLQAELRAAGVRCWRLGLDDGRPAPLQGLSAEETAPLVLRGALQRVCLERRLRPEQDLAWAELDLQLLDGRSGELRWRGRLRARGETASGGDPTRQLARELVCRLRADDDFRRAWLGGAS